MNNGQEYRNSRIKQLEPSLIVRISKTKPIKEHVEDAVVILIIGILAGLRILWAMIIGR